MRKILMTFIALVMIAVLTLTGFAAGETLALSDGSATAGQMVYLTVSLDESTVGDSVGITYSYDTAVLKAVPSACAWKQTAVLKDFDGKDSGVWAASQTVDLRGDVCILAFRILSDATVSETEVSCTLIVKKGAEKVGEYTAAGKITISCSHDFSDWKDLGSLGHSRSCSLCKVSQTQSHSWDEGQISANPSIPNTNLKTFTCTVCTATKTMEVPADSKESDPMGPSATEPVQTLPQGPAVPPTTQPGYQPPVFTTEPGGPDYNQGSGFGDQNSAETKPYQDFNQGNAPDGPDTSGTGDWEDSPVAVPAGNRAETEVTEHVHTHEPTAQTSDSNGQGAKLLLILAVTLLLAGTAFYFVHKKH